MARASQYDAAMSLRLALLPLLASLSLACTGQIASEPGPPGDGGPGADGAPAHDGGPSVPCPASTPAIGSSCTRESLQCEYGSSLYPGCDDVVQCSGGTWQSSLLGTFCPGLNTSGCPATMADAVGQLCGSGNGSCFYPTGGCYCGSLGGPVPASPDGGPIDPLWSCDSPSQGCSLPRPRLGTTCPQEGQSCQYLECAFSQQCTGGVWVGYPEGCAAAGGLGGP